ncbi:hypothetical protein ACIQVR_27400 [Streptomyces xanthochromogenes]|uniref:hypothetical protein n=1 Tax=Streptomyces xanthochromogenes TaxID=67384 RepID=UPI00380AA8FA
MHGTNAVTICSKATTHSTALGVLYKSHKLKVHSWTGVRGWVSGKYAYRDVKMCLD